MAVQQILDVTSEFLANSSTVTKDIGGWDYAVVHFVSPSGTINFLSSNDAGAVTGVSDGNAVSATNFTAIQGVILGTGSAANSTNASGMVRFSGVGQFLRLQGSGVTATKIIIRLYKAF